MKLPRCHFCGKKLKYSGFAFTHDHREIGHVVECSKCNWEITNLDYYKLEFILNNPVVDKNENKSIEAR